MKVSVDFAFAAAHHLPAHPGKCKNVHGHNYKMRITVHGAPATESGMVVDFFDVERVVTERVLSRVDHQDLNIILPNPTAELLAVWVWEQLAEPLPGLCLITIWEEPQYMVEFGLGTA